MSNVQSDPQPTPDTDAKRTSTPRKRTIEHSAAIAAYAKAAKLDEVRAGKLFRAKLRANVAVLNKHKSPSAKHAKNSPWPAHSRSALKELFPNVPQFKG